MSARLLSLLCVLTALSAAGASRFANPARALASYGAGGSDSGGESDIVRPLPFFYDLYSFRGRDGRTEVVSAFAVEAG
ncbi:MAG TPA: hypothetical protein VHG09_09730, partial [Longimicrobiales bacterium]|nr:hypothetical protein [Longimicrobiales bacterium]